MAIFGLFGKKDSKPVPSAGKKSSDGKLASDAQTRQMTTSGAPTVPTAFTQFPASRTEPGAQRALRDPAAANATAKKIDAIESEMSSEFTPTRPAPINSPTTNLPQRPPFRGPGADSAGTARKHALPPIFESTLPSIGMSTEFLLGPQGKSSDIEIIGSEAAQVIEEAAILYASDQITMAGQVLRGAIEGGVLGERTRQAWLMLFDLYWLTENRLQFDNLSMAYASAFETSPPLWPAQATATDSANTVQKDATPSPSTGRVTAPTVAFVGKLDSNIVKLLERMQKLAESSSLLRLEFNSVTAVDAIGCGLLLRILKRLNASKHDLILVGAAGLTEKIRAILKVGRRDETEAPWLLLMELQRLLNQESVFEETSIDYCVTFEVSPPAFVAAANKVTIVDAVVDAPVGNSFSMPPLVEGKTEDLIAAVSAFAASHDPVVIDCALLRRIDFNAAGQLLSSLTPLTASGRAIELRTVNHMVAALFDVMGLKDIARVIPRKS